MSHTPGKWEIKGSTIISKKGHNIAECCFDGGKTSEEQANACLIASAPELLELLKDLAKHSDIRTTSALNRVKQAIAKAEGK